MSLPTPILQSLISHTRAQLSRHYAQAECAKMIRDHYASDPDSDGERAEFEHSCVVAIMKKVAKLVVVQKALKKSMAQQIAKQRVDACCARTVASAKARAGEAY